LASSAPVRYHPFLPGGTASGAFYRVCTTDFAMEDGTCPSKVKSAFVQIEELFTTSSGRMQLEKELMLCSPLGSSPVQKRILNLWIENAFASLGMFNYPYPLNGLPAYPMKAACSKMLSTKPNQSLVYSLGQTIGVYYNSTGTNLSCFNISEEYYPCADITGCGGGVGDRNARSWDYQSCTEMIANVDTNNVTDMFPPAPYSFQNLIIYCKEKWGTIPDPLKIPMKYDYTTSSNIIFSNGYLDPWWPGGVEFGVESKNIITIHMKNAAHHLDLRGSDRRDPPDVTAAREREVSIINGWLAVSAASPKIKFPVQ